MCELIYSRPTRETIHCTSAVALATMVPPVVSPRDTDLDNEINASTGRSGSRSANFFSTCTRICIQSITRSACKKNVIANAGKHRTPGRFKVTPFDICLLKIWLEMIIKQKCWQKRTALEMCLHMCVSRSSRCFNKWAAEKWESTAKLSLKYNLRGAFAKGAHSKTSTC